jgi:biopolymer transport protein ExbD
VLIRGDERARYESVGRVLFQCTRASIQKVKFVDRTASEGLKEPPWP